MPDYTRSVIINATAHHVFGFVSKVENLPKYLPTVHGAHKQDGERIAVEGEAHGHAYNSDGYFKVDKNNRTLSWGSDANRDYSGTMQVHASGEDDSRVECTLHFGGSEPMATRPAATGGADNEIEHGLEASLLSIKNECEGAGGKVHTPAD